MLFLSRRSSQVFVWMAVFTMCLHFCEGFTPTTITAATTICDGITTPDCNVVSATTLDVNAMTANAGTGNTARFETTNMGFATTLTIDCSAAATWTNGANLVIKITNGRSTSTTILHFIILSGPLSLGSSVLVEGGSYNYNKPYCAVLLTTASSILDRSTISITGIAIEHINGYDPTYLVHLIVYTVTTDFVIDDRSTFVLDDNTVRIVNGTGPAGTYIMWHTWYVSNVCRLSKNSTVSIKNNSYTMTMASQPADLTYLLVFNSNGGLEITGYSSFDIRDFRLVVADSNFQSNTFWSTIHLPYVRVSDHSRIGIRDCNLTVDKGVSMGQQAKLFWILITGGVFTITGSSSVDVFNNTFKATGTTANEWQWYAVNSYQAPLLSDASTFSVDNNAFVIVNGTAGTSMKWSMFLLPSGMLVEQSSTMSALHTEFVITGLQGPLLQGWLIHLPAGAMTVTTGSKVDVSDLQATLSSVTVTTVYWCSMYVAAVGAVLTVDSSVVSFTNLDLSVVSSVMYNFFWQLTTIGGRIVATNNSALVLSSCKLSASNVVVFYNNWVFVTTIYGFESSQNSTLSLCENAFNVTNATVTGPMSLHMLYTPSQASSIFNGSTFNVSGNRFMISNVSVNSNWNLASVNFASSSSASGFSRILVTGNYFNFLNLISGAGASPVLVDAPALTVSNNSELSILSNTYDINNFTTTSVGVVMCTLQVTTLSVANGSIVSIFNTTYSISNSLFASATALKLPLFYSSQSVSVSGTSQIIIARNQRKHNNVTYAGGLMWNIVEALSTIKVGFTSSVNILENKQELVDATLQPDNSWQALLASDVILTDLGVLNVSSNVLGMANVNHASGGARYATLLKTSTNFSVGGGSVVAFSNYLPSTTLPTLWNITSTQPATIHTCRNEIGNTLCQMKGKGIFTCLDPSDSPIMVQAVDCDGTNTLSPIPSTSPSPSANATFSSPLTTSATTTRNSDTHSATNTPPLSNSASETRSHTYSGTHIATSTNSIPKTVSTAPSSTPTAHSDTQSFAKTPSRSEHKTQSNAPTVSPPPAVTLTATMSPPTISTTVPSPTFTLESTPIPQCNVSSFAESLSALPLFETQTLSPDSIRVGVDQVSVHNNPIDPAVFSALQAASNQQHPSTSALLSVFPERISMYGNGHGFAHIPLPEIRIFLTKETSGNITNASSQTILRLLMAATSDYKIEEDEFLTIYVGSSAIVGTLCESALSSNVPKLVLVGRLRIKSTAHMYAAPPSVAGTTIGGTVAVVGGLALGSAALAGEQIGLGAISMFSCADPRARMTFGSYRLLSPFAVYESYAGVVLGNVASILLVGIIQGLCLGVMRCFRRTRQAMERMAACRFPSMLVSISLAFHTGTAFAASQLISTSSGEFEEWEVAVGAVAFGYCVILPVVLTLHPYLRIQRAYQEYELRYNITTATSLVEVKDDSAQTSSVPASVNWPKWVLRWVMPSGAVYSTDTQQAYGAYINSYRAPATQIWWTSHTTWTASIIGLGGLAHPTTAIGCQALFVVMGVLFLLLAAVVIWQRPFRSATTSLLDGGSKILLACVLFCFAGSLSPSSTSNIMVEMGVLTLGVMLMVVTIIRAVHAAVCMYFDWRMSRDQVPLSLVWNHIPGEIKKSSRTFTTVDEDRLGDVASMRDSNIVEQDEVASFKSEGKDEELVVEMLGKDTAELTDMSSSSSSISLTNKRSKEELSSLSITSSSPSVPSSKATLSFGGSTASSKSEASLDMEVTNGSDDDDLL